MKFGDSRKHVSKNRTPEECEAIWLRRCRIGLYNECWKFPPKMYKLAQEWAEAMEAALSGDQQLTHKLVEDCWKELTADSGPFRFIQTAGLLCGFWVYGQQLFELYQIDLEHFYRSPNC